MENVERIAKFFTDDRVFSCHSAGGDPDFVEYGEKKVEIFLENRLVFYAPGNVLRPIPTKFSALNRNLAIMTSPRNIVESDSVVFYSGKITWGTGIRGTLIYRGKILVLSSPVTERKRTLRAVLKSGDSKKEYDLENEEDLRLFRAAFPFTDNPALCNIPNESRDIFSPGGGWKLVAFIFN